MRRIVYFLRWGTILVIFPTFLAYLAPWVSPVTFWPIAFLGLAYPFLLIANVFFLICWLILRKKYLWLSLSCILLGLNHFTNFVGTGFGKSVQFDQTISVMSYNLKYLQKIGSTDHEIREKKQKEFIDFLESDRPQIFCLQEAISDNVDMIKAKLKYRYKYMYGARGSAILSDFPILDKGVVDFGNKYNFCVWADLDVNGQRTKIYSIYLSSNHVSNMTNDVMEAELQSKETWKTIGGILRNIKNAGQRRARQAKVLNEKIAASKYPVIIAGDLNDTPLSYTYNQLSKNLQDTFQEKGRGIATTYSGSIPALRIDYILADSRFDVNDFKIFKNDYSDHYPILAKMTLTSNLYEEVNAEE